MKKQIKKGLSLIMAVLMVLSCWVWVAPTEAEAVTAGKYYFRFVYTITDDAAMENAEFYAVYKENNGKGTEEKLSANYGSQVKATVGTHDITGEANGFPVAVRIKFRLPNLGGSLRFNKIKIYMSGVSGDVLKESSLVYEDAYEWSNGATANVDYDQTYPFANIEYPKPSSIGGFTDTPVDLNVPKTGVTTMNTTPLMTGIVYDQYGAVWYEAPDYALSMTAGNYEAKEEIENVLTLTTQGDGAKVSVGAAMQTVSQLANDATATYKRYYLVASIQAGELTPVASQPININYPQYNTVFRTDYVTNAADAATVNKLNDGTTYTGSINDDDEITDADKNFIKAYGQSLGAYPVDATKEGYGFYGYWSEPQPMLPVDGTDPTPYAYESTFRVPVDTKTYNELYANDDTLKNKYYPAGVKFDPANNADLLTVTDDTIYYAWFLSNDITVKFYQLDGKYISEFTTKYGKNHEATDVTWPVEGRDFPSSYDSGAYTYNNWSGTWEDINGDIVNPSGYRFVKNLVLTPVYRNINFTDKYYVTVYRGVQANTFGNQYTKEYNYRDIAVLPAASALPSVPSGNDYRYEFVGWSTQEPEVKHQGVHYRHIILEDADFDTAGNAVFLVDNFVVRDDVSYYPVYRRYLQSHDVTFTYTDSTGATKTETIPFKYGSVITAPEGVPSEFASSGYGYKFLGWVPAGQEETVDLRQQICTKAGMAFNAKYSEGIPTPYTITFEYRNEKGEIKTTAVEVKHGAKILQSTLDSLKPAGEFDDVDLNALLKYNGIWEFNGTRYNIADLSEYSPTSHVTFKAVYEDPTPFFNATYVDGGNTESFRILEGEPLKTWYADDEETMPYEPTKDDTLEGEYTFVCWADELQTEEQIIKGEIAGTIYEPGATPITEDVTLYPQFMFSKYTYKVTFKNWNGAVLATGTYNYKDDITALKEAAEAAAVRGNDKVYSYTFIGWDKVVPSFCEGGEPNSETVFIAQYKSNYLYYSVEWYNDSDLNADEKLSTSKYVYGDKIYAPGVTVTPPTSTEAGRVYVLSGWKYLDKDGNVQTYRRGMSLDDALIPDPGNTSAPVKMWADYTLTDLSRTVKVVINDGVNAKIEYTIDVKDGEPIGDLISTPASGWLSDAKHNEFIGWSTDEEGARDADGKLANGFDVANTSITADGIVLYAQFDVKDHVRNLEAEEKLPTYPMAGYTDYDNTEVPASDGKGIMGTWCACSKEKTYVATKEIPALTDNKAPAATGYIGTANWSDFEAAANADTVYANKNTNLIITTTDTGDENTLYNSTGKGIGVQYIETVIAPVEAADFKTLAELTEYLENNEVTWKQVYNWTTIQAALIQYYGGWAKVPAVYKDYNANYTDKAETYGLTDGETYVAYVKVTDKAGNISYMRSAKFYYDETKPALEISGDKNYTGDLYCKQATIKVTEATKDYKVYDNGNLVTVATASGEYKFGAGAHQVVVKDKAGNIATIYFQVAADHSLIDYNLEATCFDDGFTSQRCTNCGKDFNKTVITTEGHKYKDTIVPATCDEIGYISRECEICDNPAERLYYDADGKELYPKLAHSYGEPIVKEATCSETGFISKTCTKCKHQEFEELPLDTENGHTFRTYKIKPTCSLGGEEYLKCRDPRCSAIIIVKHGYVAGDAKFDGVIYNADNYDAAYAPTNHSGTKEVWEVTTEATCYAEGVETKKCSICKATITDVSGNAVTQTIARIPHIWTVKETEEDGKIWITYVCSVCGAEKVDENGVVIKVEKPALATYTVTFKVEGEEAASITKTVGETIAASEVAVPTKDATDEFTYEFAGWYLIKEDGTVSNTEYTLPMVVTADVQLAAKFKETRIFYTSVFQVPTTYDATLGFADYESVKTLMGALGDTRLPGETPVFAETDTFEFEFTGWVDTKNKDDFDGVIEGNGTYQATFKATQKKYNVIFLNGGAYFDKVEVAAGEDAVVPTAVPTKDADAEYHYTFSGWYTTSDCKVAADFTEIVDNMTVYAGFTSAAHDEGDSATVKTPASCEDSEITEYTCKDCGYKWDKVTAPATGHKRGTPVYNAETGKNEIFCTVCNVKLDEADASYTIRFVDHDGSYIDEFDAKVNATFYDQAADAAKKAYKDPDSASTYSFAGWAVKGTTTVIASDKLPAATADVIYVAQYTATPRLFTVTFAKDDYTPVISFTGIKYGTLEATLADGTKFDVSTYAFDADLFGVPKADGTYHYAYESWNFDFSGGIVDDTLILPKYSKEKHNFDKNGDGQVTTADAEATNATCTESGGYKYSCTKDGCGHYYITGNISALGHNWTSKVVKEPTFKEEGLAVNTCQRCGITEEEVLPKKDYITVTVTVKDSNGKAYEGAKVTITHDVSGKSYGPNLTNPQGVATFKVEESGKYFVTILEIPGHEGGVSGNITVDGSGNITDNTVPTLKGESHQNCSCGCHRANFWGMLFRFFHKIIKFFAGRYICCECPDSRY